MSSKLDRSYPYEIRLQAMEWRVRIDGGDMDSSARAEFDKWLASDVRHEQAFDRASTAWVAYNSLSRSDLNKAYFKLRLLDRFRSKIIPSDKTRYRRRLRTGGFALAIASMCIAALAFTQTGLRVTPSLTTVEPTIQVYETETAEFSRINLSDSSEITLGPDTKIEVRFSDDRRGVRLLDGSAVFHVSANEDWPFVVESGAFSATVLGTIFDVRNSGGIVRLSVLEGEVEAAHPFVIGEHLTSMVSRMRLTDGEQVSASATNGLSDLETFRAEHFATWQDGRLRYFSATLREVIDDANRYYTKPILIEDPEGYLSDLKVTFAFDGNNVDGMLSALPTMLPVSVDHSSSEGVYVRPVKPG